MPNKMLIDASHPEETRVVVLRGNRIEEFDFESQDKKQLRGNIYLARVTRVEPSLQAAFVEYGGNRHGFLAFSEIHPDYYQIPVADRQAILKAEAEEARAADDEAEENDAQSGRGKKRRRGSRRSGKPDSRDEASVAADAAEAGESQPAQAEAVQEDVISETFPSENNGAEEANGSDEVDTVGAEDALDEAESRRRHVRRSYKIQEVIKRRQILLVQVVKEERGSKGAALTTYLSLAGRYSVLMPNTARGGGISRKITNVQDRKRLKDVVKSLDVPDGMGVILRTAGANRTKAEVKRDYEYLMRLWERVRGLTLQSIAPALVYEEGSLIKRSVRDLYNKDIDEILVAGEEGYREAKDFMRMLMPSHAKVVQPYRDTVPIFARNGIEAQLDKMLQPQVTLRSGGYIIINQTEALVAIDVNSGRSTKEHSIEDTALQTNLEAAEEVSRQLRLRDLAGLIVIDFIDMEENRNNRAVEKRLKDCLKNDRARIQVGRISHFGLLEMSRQRIRSSVLESTMQPCPHCGGTGHVRSDSSVALMVVRAIEEYLLKDGRHDITVRTPTTTALYLLNHKRSTLVELELRFGVEITIATDEELGNQHYAIVKGEPSTRAPAPKPAIQGTPEVELETEDEVPAEETADEPEERSIAAEEQGLPGRKRRRKRRRRGGRDRASADHAAPQSAEEAEEGDEPSEAGEETEAPVAADAGEEEPRKKRHRGKRGGKRNRREEGEEAAPEDAMTAPSGEEATEPAVAEPEPAPAVAEAAPTPEAPAEEAPAKKPRRKTRAKKEAAVEEAPQAEIASPPDSETHEEPAPAAADATEAVPEEKEKKPASRRRTAAAADASEEPEPVVSSTGEEGEAPRKTGWWQRKSFF
ncbi:Rne/Rng family ribonuclease [Chelativorans sp. AA-79]|uniref:Rne/Rng family ribonuclease n=1 Tax=Chelativorans sp. AA-79 TaxID=3028735 RepID=UPI0023F70594|nr:Rne/Rng family ribonuclease [Chelativorans sp. AA-79]WEX07082.1 Rne/Rng family ribonuclease [Chelativorans sp. AA-79]